MPDNGGPDNRGSTVLETPKLQTCRSQLEYLPRMPAHQ